MATQDRTTAFMIVFMVTPNAEELWLVRRPDRRCGMKSISLQNLDNACDYPTRWVTPFGLAAQEARLDSETWRSARFKERDLRESPEQRDKEARERSTRSRAYDLLQFVPPVISRC